MWIAFALASALFAGIVSMLAKIGIRNTDSNLATALRTIVVLVFSWIMFFAVGSQSALWDISPKGLVFLVLPGLAAGASWLCYFRVLQEGPASVVVPIDKLSILVTVTFGYFAFHEKLSKKAILGLIMIIAGTLSLLL